MYTVLIVDDEEPVLESYSHMLAEGIEGFRCVGTARSGSEALREILEKRPDVVFMDISMPGIDGLETISRVHESVPSTVFILSTAYERFDIARRAIPLGIHAYLVKPVTRRVFTETLESVRDRLERERSGRDRAAGEPQGMRSGAERDLMEEAFLRDGITAPLTQERWAAFREALNLESDRGLVALGALDSAQTDSLKAFRRANELLSRKYRFLFGRHLGLSVYFVSGEVDGARFERDLSEALDEAVGRGTPRWIGSGNATEGPDFSASRSGALSRLQSLRKRSDALVRHRIGLTALRQKLGFTAAEEYRSRFAEWRDDCFASLPFEEAKLRLVSALTLLLDDVTGLYRAGGSVLADTELDPSAEAAPLSDAAACERWSDPAVAALAGLAERERSANLPVPLVRALSFIASRYHECLQLSDVAEEARVSPAYLSRIFGEHLGVSFVEYLTALRVETAERLLRERSLSVKEVAHAVGFQDPNYFSKAFRKRTGLSPKAYAGQDRFDAAPSPQEEISE